ncbi:SprT family zinc-dependent metalloprotease [Desulfosporosinus burensis]
MLNLEIGSTIIPYSIRKSTRAKHVSITVGIDGVKVVAPVGVGDDRIIPVVEEKREWIFNKVEGLKLKNEHIQAKRELVSGVKLPFRGKDFTLRVLEYDGRYTRVTFEGERFVVYINKNLPLDKRQGEIHKALERWYVVQAKEFFHSRLTVYKDRLGLDFNQVRLKNQKTRWGSCSRKGNLNLNWRLVMAPTFIVDYVVVHELCHLKIMNHSEEFWQLVESIIPDYKDRKRWLKQHGIELRL